MSKIKKVKEVYAETCKGQSNPLDLPALKKELICGNVEGYVQRQGKLSDGNSFAVVYLILKG
jgi:hypothetical protein